MALKSNLRQTQSLRNISASCDLPTCTEDRLLNWKVSVSQLVARYQSTVEVNASTQATPRYDSEVKLKQATSLSSLPYVSSLLDSKESQLQSLMRRNEEREMSRASTNLKHSKSVGSLQSGSGTIDALRALFESKADIQHKVKNSFRSAKTADMIPQWMNTEDEVFDSPTEIPHMENSYPFQDSDDKDVVTAKDLSASVRERRQGFNEACRALINKGIRFSMHFPITLTVYHNGTEHKLETKM
ncbi:uncharacterized protein LOC117518235 [Thalassophryne amazonica]|uniref:uncharacterized protein LOC117518235 n=1 Tax=Thalassophryne amazonica TaxID=390379 RepID=UPI001470B096|nr:uncharacterized protein LOC117518235 [Thalassophryne amazonica]